MRANINGVPNPRPSCFEGFDPPEATAVGHRGSKSPMPSLFEEAAGGNDGRPQRLNKNPRPSIVEDFDPPEATTVGRR